MFPSPSLPWFELARFRRSRITRAAVLAVAIVPLFYGALYIWANLDPTGRLDNVQAAVVNEDEMIEAAGQDGKKQPVAVGRELAANLIGDDSRNNYDWLLTDAADARAGLADGTYKAVLTIPEDLSKAATSTSGDPSAAVQGRLDLKTNDAVNFVNGQIADRILDAAKSSLNAQVTETYLGNLYLGFTDIKASLEEAADGAGQLADGAGELTDGAGQLDDGARALADGNRQLAAGAGELDSGANELAEGLGTITDRTRGLPGQTEQLADGAEQVAGGVGEINDLVQGLADGLTSNTGPIVDRLGDLEDSLRTAAQTCRNSGTPGDQCANLDAAADAAAQAAGQVDGLAGQVETGAGQVRELNDGAQRVAQGNRRLADSVPALVGGLQDASDGAGQLASGTGQLADGARDAADGADQLASGTGQLVDGAGALRDGALELQSGLSDGSEQVPDYTEDERDQLAKTAATPVTDAADRLNKVSSYGEGLAPYFMALALWVGAMSIYLLLRPLSARAVASAAGSVRTALAGFVPGAALSLVQAVLLVGVLLGVVGVGASQPWLLLGLAVLTGLVFTAINQTFIAWFGGAGRFLAIVFVCLQLTAAGGTYPIETSPSFFGFLHSLLPMTYAVHGFRAATAGGTEGVAFDAFILVVFALLALGATALAAKRRQRVSITRLHPTLQV